jgi:streptogramin lyase
MFPTLGRNGLGLRDQRFGRSRSTSSRSSQRNHYRPRIEALEDRQLLALIVSEFPTALTAGAAPSQITTGPDGNLWFTEAGSSKIGKMKPDGTLVTEITLPAGSDPEGITTGPDGNLWFAEFGTSKIGHVSTAGSLFPEVTLPAGSEPFQITTGPDGNLWFTEFGTSKIGHVSTAGSLFPEITLPAGSGPAGLTTGPDNNLWYTDFTSGKIGHLSTAGSLFPEVTLPTGSEPDGIVTGSDNNLWFAEVGTGKVGHISTAGALFPEVTLSAGSGPRFITAAPDGNLYVTENGNGKIAQITTAGALSEQATGVAASAPRGITVGPNGNVYFTDQGANKIGEVITGNFVSGALFNNNFITNDNTPTFKGKTKGGALVIIVAQGLTHPASPIAFGFANPDGSWSLTSRTLPDDSYQISAQSVDGGGGGATPLVALTTTAKPLVISTTGPVITAVVYNARARQITINFQDAVGLSPTTLMNMAFYSVTGKGVSIASIAATLSGTNATVVLTLNGGKKPPKNVRLTVISGGIVDLAGNALDGVFLGTFPTSSTQPGNFSAVLPIKFKKPKIVSQSSTRIAASIRAVARRLIARHAAQGGR